MMFSKLSLSQCKRRFLKQCTARISDYMLSDLKSQSILIDKCLTHIIQKRLRPMWEGSVDVNQG